MSPSGDSDEDSNIDSEDRFSSLVDLTALSDYRQKFVKNARDSFYQLKPSDPRDLDRQTIRQHGIYLFVAVLLVASPYAVISGAVVPTDTAASSHSLSQPDCTTYSPTDDHNSSIRATVTKVDGEDQIRIRYNQSSLAEFESLSRFSIRFDSSLINITNTSGLNRRFDGRYVWTGDDAPSFTYSFTRNVSTGMIDGVGLFEAGSNWALAPLPTTYPLQTDYSVQPDGYIHPSSEDRNIVYVGEIRRTVVRQAGCQQIVLHLPTASPATDLDGVSSHVEVVSRSYPLGSRYETVTGLVVPWNMSQLGGYATGNTFFVDRYSSVSTQTMAAHEYLHTRQNSYYGPRMEWLREAVPSYYEVRLPYENGEISTGAYRGILAIRSEEAVWNEPYATVKSSNHYNRGAVTLAALDSKIRDTTGGNRSLLHVLRALHRNYNSITYDRFRETTTSMTNESVGYWIDQHIRRGHPVEVPALANSSLPDLVWISLYLYERYVLGSLLGVSVAIACSYFVVISIHKLGSRLRHQIMSLRSRLLS